MNLRSQGAGPLVGGGRAGSSVRATFGRSWPVLLSYGVFSMWGVGCLFTSLMLTSGGFGMSPGNVAALAGVLVATVAGHVLGNLLGLAGLRLLPITLLFLGLFIGSTLSGLVLGAFALFLVIAIFAAFGGYLGVASRLDVIAAWYPLAFSIGGAIHWMNRHGGVATFQTGAKHALWDPFTIVCLTGTVFLMLTFLATRHSLGLTTWQEVGRPRGAAREPTDAVAVARPGRGSFLVLFLFTLAVLGATALISPYLFRTRAPDGDGPYKDDTTSGEGGGSSQGGASSGQSSGGGQSSSGASSSGASSGQSSGGASSGESSGGGSSGGASSGQSSGGGSSGQSSSGASSGESSGASSSGASSEQSSGGGASSGQSGSGGSGSGTSSGQSSGGGESSGQSSGGAASGEGQSASGGEGSSDPPIGEPDTERAGNAAGEALSLGLKVFLGLLIAALALFLFMVVFVPPLRRVFLMRHLERPLWPVAPTARVMNLWRRALAVLGTIDIEPAPGETPCDFARRVDGELASALGCDAPGLKEAATIVEKIDYAGRGLGAGDEQTMRQAIDAFVAAVSPRIPAKKKVAAAWGRAPEVES